MLLLGGCATDWWDLLDSWDFIPSGCSAYNEKHLIYRAARLASPAVHLDTEFQELEEFREFILAHCTHCAVIIHPQKKGLETAIFVL